MRLVEHFFLDVIEDYAAHGRFELDPVWTTTALLGATLYVVMWTRKRLCRLAR